MNFVLFLIRSIYPPDLIKEGLDNGDQEKRSLKDCCKAISEAADYHKEKSRVWRAHTLFANEAQVRTILTELETDLASSIVRSGIKVELDVVDFLRWSVQKWEHYDKGSKEKVG